MDLVGPLWKDGSLWILMDPDGSRWIPMDPDGSKWIPMGPDGSRWILMALCIISKGQNFATN